MRLILRLSAADTRQRAGVILGEIGAPAAVTVAVEGLSAATVKAHADFICVAVNSHDGLVSSLEGLLKYADCIVCHPDARNHVAHAVAMARAEHAKATSAAVAPITARPTDGVLAR